MASAAGGGRLSRDRSLGPRSLRASLFLYLGLSLRASVSLCLCFSGFLSLARSRTRRAHTHIYIHAHTQGRGLSPLPMPKCHLKNKCNNLPRQRPRSQSRNALQGAAPSFPARCIGGWGRGGEGGNLASGRDGDCCSPPLPLPGPCRN